MVLLSDTPQKLNTVRFREGDLIAHLLMRRGITDHTAAETFLRPSFDEHLFDPLLLTDMPKAATRLGEAITRGERIAVWSDYDCDGIPGGVLLHDFLKKAGANFTNYIPHRHEEGYGVNEDGIEKLAKEGTVLLITVDSGIADHQALKSAKEKGMEVIVTDHHLPTRDGLPPAFAVIDPKREDETYPFRDLCGAGLAWKLVAATLSLSRGIQASWTADIPLGWEKWLLDMAGFATIADMVPLVGENRVLAKYGLLVMRKSPRVGFMRLCGAARVNQRFITEDDVAFSLAPRVNAASRMGDPRDAFTLFTTIDETEADRLSRDLEKANRARRAQAGAITRAAREKLESRVAEGTMPSVIALGDPDWRPGLLGLVANTLMEEFARPVFLWGREGTGKVKGSCRSTPDMHVVRLMEKSKDLFVEFGGHAQSGGFSLHEDAVFRFETELGEAYGVLMQETVDVPGEREQIPHGADAVLSFSEATKEFLTHLEQLAPFGLGNEKPIFAFQNIIVERVTWFGKSNEHVKLLLRNDEKTVLEAVAFFAKRECKKACTDLVTPVRRSVLGSLERDPFTRGAPVRLRLHRIH